MARVNGNSSSAGGSSRLGPLAVDRDHGRAPASRMTGQAGGAPDVETGSRTIVLSGAHWHQRPVVTPVTSIKISEW